MRIWIAGILTSGLAVTACAQGYAPSVYRVGQAAIYQNTEQMAEFPGGSEQLRAFIRSYLKYPPAAKKKDREGRVVITFVVLEDGSITDIRVSRSAGKDLDEEAIRLVDSMPCWIPGKQNGRAVPVYFHLPVTFKLE